MSRESEFKSKALTPLFMSNKGEILKLTIKLISAVLVLLALIVVLEWLLIMVPGEGPIECAWKSNVRAITGQGKIQLAFIVKDQNGEVVANYPIKVAVTNVRWYWWIFPGTRQKMRYYSIRTNENGIAKFEPYLHGHYVEPLEVDNNNYSAIKNGSTLLWPKINYTKDGIRPSWGSKDVIYLAKGSYPKDPIELKVIKHDPPEKLIGLRLDYSQQSVTPVISEEAPEDITTEVTLKSSSRDNPYKENWITLRVNVIGAKAYAIAAKKRQEGSTNITMPTVEWVIEGEEGVEFIKVPDYPENIPFAPVNEYCKKISIDDQEHAYFIRNSKVSPPIYYRFRPGLGFRGNIVDILSSVQFNPTGSRNLYIQGPIASNSRNPACAIE